MKSESGHYGKWVSIGIKATLHDWESESEHHNESESDHQKHSKLLKSESDHKNSWILHMKSESEHHNEKWKWPPKTFNTFEKWKWK